MTSTTNSGIANQLAISLEMPVDSAQRQEILSLMLKKYAQVINTKTGGLYDLTEFINFEQYFTSGNPQVFRTVFRQTYILPATPPGTTTTVAHNIVGLTQFTRMFGCCITNFGGIDYRPIPFVSALATAYIELRADNTNFYILNGPGAPTILSGTIVLEYLKQ